MLETKPRIIVLFAQLTAFEIDYCYTQSKSTTEPVHIFR
jgi:hypothetical protein